MVMRLQLLFQQLPPACAAPVGTSPVCAAPAGASPKDISSAASSSLLPSEYGHPHTIFLWPTIFQKIQPFHLVRPQPRKDYDAPSSALHLPEFFKHLEGLHIVLIQSDVGDPFQSLRRCHFEFHHRPGPKIPFDRLHKGKHAGMRRVEKIKPLFDF